MSTTTLNMRCPCGATLSYVGDSPGYSRDEFLQEHHNHTAPPALPVADLVKIATESALDLATIKDAVDAVQQEIANNTVAAATQPTEWAQLVRYHLQNANVSDKDRCQLEDLAAWLDSRPTLAPIGATISTAPANNHIEVMLGPDETITIKTDPARCDGNPAVPPKTVLRGRLIVGKGSSDGVLPPHMRLDNAYGVAWREDV